jgi:tripartite-type tricarboxylate transporter receptor subunit TctC
MPLRPALRRRGLLGLGLLLATPALASASRRQPVELLVPGPPGSAADRWARGVAPFLERAWPRQSLALRNVAGRGGLEMLAELAAAPPGRKVIGVLTTPLLLARAIEAGEASPLSRIAPLAALVEEPVVLVTAPGGASDIARLSAGAAPAPIGAPPPGSGAYVTAQRMAERLSLPLLSFPSAAAARQAAAAGHVAAAALTLPDALGFLRDGKLVALGVASSQRTPLLPELPTLREAGLELLGATRRGFALPTDANPEWRFWLLNGLETLAADPDLTTHCAETGQVPRFLGPEPFRALLARQEEALRRRWREEPWLPRRA